MEEIIGLLRKIGLFGYETKVHNKYNRTDALSGSFNFTDNIINVTWVGNQILEKNQWITTNA
jgi:hypothetical protein